MKQTLITLFFLLLLTACVQEPLLIDDGVATAVSLPTPTLTQTETAVITPPTSIPTIVLTPPTPQKLKTTMPDSGEPSLDLLTIKETPTKSPTTSPALTETPLVAESWPTLTSQEYGFSLLYNQRGRLFQFDISSQTATPFALPVQGDVRDALLSGDGRYLAFAYCFAEPDPGPYEGVLTGEIRQLELASGQVETVG